MVLQKLDELEHSGARSGGVGFWKYSSNDNGVIHTTKINFSEDMQMNASLGIMKKTLPKLSFLGKVLLMFFWELFNGFRHSFFVEFQIHFRNSGKYRLDVSTLQEYIGL